MIYRLAIKTLCWLTVLLVPAGSFAASPRINFLLHCSGCHHPTGEGAPPNVPTMHDELGRMMSVPEMRTYLVRVPGSAQSSLSDAELTDVVNWILQEFNATTMPAGFEPLRTEEVTAARKEILLNPLEYRIRYWRDYDESQFYLAN